MIREALLTDLDDSMVPSTIVTCGKVVDMDILRKKVHGFIMKKDILF